jgi:hypothetical protein
MAGVKNNDFHFQYMWYNDTEDKDKPGFGEKEGTTMIRLERVRSHVAILDRALANEFECNCEKHRTDVKK